MFAEPKFLTCEYQKSYLKGGVCKVACILLLSCCRARNYPVLAWPCGCVWPQVMIADELSSMTNGGVPAWTHCGGPGPVLWRTWSGSLWGTWSGSVLCLQGFIEGCSVDIRAQGHNVISTWAKWTIASVAGGGLKRFDQIRTCPHWRLFHNNYVHIPQLLTLQWQRCK